MNPSSDIDHLEPMLRVLLTSDGTVTDILQALCGEKINARKLAQEVQPAVVPFDALGLSPGEPLMTRRVLLQGDRTGTNYVYAESRIAVGRLDGWFQKSLLNSAAPIGRLWRDNRVETFKEILRVSEVPAGNVAGYLGIAADAKLPFRTCRVFIGRRPVMLITEHFAPAIAASTRGHNSKRRPCSTKPQLTHVVAR